MPLICKKVVNIYMCILELIIVKIIIVIFYCVTSLTKENLSKKYMLTAYYNNI